MIYTLVDFHRFTFMDTLILGVKRLNKTLTLQGSVAVWGMLVHVMVRE